MTDQQGSDQCHDGVHRSGLERYVADGLWITLVTAFLYLCTYKYELGYCQYFGLSSDVVSVDLSILLLFCAAALSWLCILAPQLNFAIILLRPLDVVLRVFLLRNLLLFGIGVAVWFLLSPSLLRIIIIVLISSIIAFDAVVLLLARGPAGYWNTVKHSQAMDAYPIASAGQRILGSRLYWVSVGALFIYALAGPVGVLVASRTTWFHILEEDEAMVAVRIRENKAFCVEFDHETHRFGSRWTVVNIDARTSTTFERRKVGPLRPQVLLHNAETTTGTATSSN